MSGPNKVLLFTILSCVLLLTKVIFLKRQVDKQLDEITHLKKRVFELEVYEKVDSIMNDAERRRYYEMDDIHYFDNHYS